MNRLWINLIIMSILYSMFNGTLVSLNDVLPTIGKSTLDYVIPLVANLAFFSGILEVVLDNGLLNKLQKWFAPIIDRLFPDLINQKKAKSYIVANVLMNMLGLGSCATPSGLLAMQEMQKKNNHTDTATRSMVTFLVLNTAGVTLFNTTILSLRAQFDSQAISSFMPYAIVVTIITCCIALVIDRILNYGYHK